MPSPGDQAASTGRHGQFLWLIATHNFYIGDLLASCPEIVVGKYIAIAARLSGSFPDQRDFDPNTGWRSDGEIAYSPSVEAPLSLPYQYDGRDTPGFDEWYIFENPPRNLGQIYHGNPFEGFEPVSGSILRFVGMLGVSLDNLDPSLAKHFDWFWKQMAWIQPDAYVADGADGLTFLTPHDELFEHVRRTVVGLARNGPRKTGFPEQIGYTPGYFRQK